MGALPNEKQREALRRLGALLDSIDDETRQPGEPSLRTVFKEHATEQLEKFEDGA